MDKHEARTTKNIPDNITSKFFKSLQAKMLIKEVVNIQGNGRKHFIAVEFEPSKEITGGAWYVPRCRFHKTC